MQDARINPFERVINLTMNQSIEKYEMRILFLLFFVVENSAFDVLEFSSRPPGKCWVISGGIPVLLPVIRFILF